MSTLFTTIRILTLSFTLRLILLLYGLLQDAYSPVKYTDIDYHVFTSAAAYISRGISPYQRETYRYTPLLAWLLLPTTWGRVWFEFGKCLFALGDLGAGWLMVLILRDGSNSETNPADGKGNPRAMSEQRALKFASIWLLNPMVATISTRGSSEGLLGFMVMALLWAVLRRRFVTAGCLLGLCVHFKIYPFIYAPSIIWWMDDERLGLSRLGSGAGRKEKIQHFCSRERIIFSIASLLTFVSLNGLMYYLYGYPFLHNTFLHHLSRIDHRHNFSPYNTLLYLSSSRPSPSFSSHTMSLSPWSSLTHIKPESFAFLPQLLLSAVLIPFLLAKKDLASTMLVQTFAFVTFNKVCTSQYFLWYLALLPLHLPYSRLISRPRLGLTALVLWTATQGWWLQKAYELEFLGRSTFVSMWWAALGFGAVNCWILGELIGDFGDGDGGIREI